MTPARPSTTLTETLAQAEQNIEDIMEIMRPARPSTTLTESLNPSNEEMSLSEELASLREVQKNTLEFADQMTNEAIKLQQDRLEATREIRGISDEMSRIVGYMNEPKGDDI